MCFVPDIFLFEILSITTRKCCPIDATVQRYRALEKHTLQSVSLSDTLIQTASEIAQTGHPKSGSPSFYDASYHALALLLETHLITSDHRHYAKTQ